MKSIPGLRGQKRGSVLLLALFFLFALFLMAVAFFRLLPTELHSAARSSRETKAHYAADAGARDAVGWLKTKPVAVPNADIDAYNTLHSDPANGPIDGYWSYTCQIESIDPTRGIYGILATAMYNGRPARELRAVVQNQSFAKYALWWDDQDTSELGIVFAMSSDGIQGPVHTNSYFRLAAGSSSFWSDGGNSWVTGVKDSAGNPLEPAKMTYATAYEADDPDNALGMAPDGVQYYGGNYAGSNVDLTPYDSSGLPIADRYERIVEGGRERISQVTPIEMPEENTELRVNAWDQVGGDTSDMPGSNGLYINTDGNPNEAGGDVAGGIYIRGDADVTLGITSGNGDHQKITARQGNTTVPGPDSTVWRADIPYAKQWYQPPDYQEPTWECTSTKTVNGDPIYGPWYDCSYTKTGRYPECGTEIIYIPGEGGALTPVQQYKICTVNVPKNCHDVIGYEQVQQCVWEVTGSHTVHPDGYWVDVPLDTPGATIGFHKNQVVAEDYTPPPGYESYTATPTVTTSTITIEDNQSAIEVNGSAYQIPIDSDGVMVNGELITDPADSRLTVADGSTVYIDHDSTKNGVYYGEFTVMNGRTNGIVFSDGNIKKLQGTNKGAYYTDTAGNEGYHGRTIAANLGANKRVEIYGDILQYYNGSDLNASGQPLNDGNNRLKPGNLSPNPEHILGLIGYDIVINPNKNQHSSWYSGNRAIDVYAVLMAGKMVGGDAKGGFYTNGDHLKNDDHLGEFNLFGGLITANLLPVQKAYAGSSYANGFKQEFNYDWMAAQNLQNFPSTNTFSVLRYVQTHVE
ncbi:MAG: hypothetical protein AB7S38_33270 [Vulcanimicrobiota bacterium]